MPIVKEKIVADQLNLIDQLGGRQKSNKLNYLLITAARDEVTSIELTINSVVRQIARPLRWVIVSDGSTDGTDELVMKSCVLHDWIEIIRIPKRKERNFAGKVAAFQTGYSHIKHLAFDLVGNIDADVSFDENFFAFLLNKFGENPKLGIGGTPFQEDAKSYDFRFSSTEHVSGACQLFRRQCYEEIGGYTPIRGGGIDVVAVLSARMHGWQTKTFTEKFYIHHRKMGTANGNVLQARFKDGQKDYSLGAHPIWMFFRALYQMTKRPMLIGGTVLLAGYLSSLFSRLERPISQELVNFRRRDQLRRLRSFVKKSCAIVFTHH